MQQQVLLVRTVAELMNSTHYLFPYFFFLLLLSSSAFTLFLCGFINYIRAVTTVVTVEIFSFELLPTCEWCVKIRINEVGSINMQEMHECTLCVCVCLSHSQNECRMCVENSGYRIIWWLIFYYLIVESIKFNINIQIYDGFYELWRQSQLFVFTHF